MKKTIPALLFCLVTRIAIGQNIVYDTIQYAKEYHQQRLKLFQTETIVTGKFIFLGNSITEFGDWRTLLNDTTVINRGIAGDNTFGVLARLADIVNRHPAKLFIEIGINDISQNIPIDTIVINIATILNTVSRKSPGTKMYLHSILPTNDNVRNNYPAAYNKNEFVETVNTKLKQIARKYNAVYINLHKLLKDKNRKLDLQYADADGLHLNELAYKKWIALLKKRKYL